MNKLNPWYLATGSMIFALVVVLFSIFYLKVPTSYECKYEALQQLCYHYSGYYGILNVYAMDRGYGVDCGTPNGGVQAVVNISFKVGG